MAKDLWENSLALILDEISMVFLKLLSTVDICLNQVKSKISNNTAVLGGLAFIIVIGNFYQFFLVFERFLWTHHVTSKILLIKVCGIDLYQS